MLLLAIRLLQAENFDNGFQEIAFDSEKLLFSGKINLSEMLYFDLDINSLSKTLLL